MRRLDEVDVEMLVRREVEVGVRKHGDVPWSRHEFYAILLEEVEELWDAIKADASECRVQEEAVQVGAVVSRYLQTRGGTVK